LTKIDGYLDHLRENLETLDEQIVNARKMSRLAGGTRIAVRMLCSGRRLSATSWSSATRHC
jgi:hypothetical protein